MEHMGMAEHLLFSNMLISRSSCMHSALLRTHREGLRTHTEQISFFNYAPHLFENSALPMFHLEILTYVSTPYAFAPFPGEYVDHIRTTF
jgi:hypothetical protein